MLSTWSWWNVTLSTCLNSRESVWMSAQAGSRMMKSTRTWPLLLILMGMFVGLTPSRSRPSLSLEHDWTSTERTLDRMLFCYNPTNIFPNWEVLCDELVTRDGDTHVTSHHMIKGNTCLWVLTWRQYCWLDNRWTLRIFTLQNIEKILSWNIYIVSNMKGFVDLSTSCPSCLT